VIGTRILQLKLIGRNQPEAKAKTHIPSHWIEAMQLARPRINFDNMTVYQFLREIAKVGGFLARKGDGEPGWITIWRGMEFLMQLIDGINLGRNAK
ncbi:MAG: transposase, partial [Planctomycetes bacterium]|nr:transposase [Planctomycetota bacterium]